jgi:hypothetical protein
MRKSEGNVLAIVITIIVILAIAGALGLVAWKHFNPDKKASVQTSSKPASSQQVVDTSSYCLKEEKLCFTYPSTWSVDDQGGSKGSQPGETVGDLVYVTAPESWLRLTMRTAIDGVGGTCGGSDDQSQNLETAFILDATPISGMTGFQNPNNKEGTTDQLYIAKLVNHDSASSPYIPYVYATNSVMYTTPQTLKGLYGNCLSDLVPGRNAVVPDVSPVIHGDITVGMMYEGTSTKIPGSPNLDGAKAQFDSQPYKEAISILSSLHYQ